MANRDFGGFFSNLFFSDQNSLNSVFCYPFHNLDLLLINFPDNFFQPIQPILINFNAILQTINRQGKLYENVVKTSVRLKNMAQTRQFVTVRSDHDPVS